MTQARRRIEESAWTTDAVVRVTAAIVLGGAICFGGWLAASSKAAVADQLPLVPMSVLGLVVALYAQAMWLVQGRRAIGDRARHLLGEPESIRLSVPVHTPDAGLVAGKGLGRYHRSTCPIVEAGWRSATRAAHEAAGRQACGVCRP